MTVLAMKRGPLVSESRAHADSKAQPRPNMDSSLAGAVGDDGDDGYRIFGAEREADHLESARKTEKRQANRVRRALRLAVKGDNTIGSHAFLAVVRFAYPLADYPKQHRTAIRTGRLEWSGGIVFVRVAKAIKQAA